MVASRDDRVRPLVGRRLLVTGGSGQLGRHLVSWIVQAGGESISVDRRRPEQRITGVTYRQADIRDLGRLRTIFEEHRPDTVIHLAALAGPREADDPGAYMDLNFGGTLAVLEACRTMGKLRVVVASSAHVYGRPTGVGPLASLRRSSERHPARPISAYALSKRGAEEQCELWVRYGFASIAIARLGNCFGDPHDKGVVATLLRQLRQGEAVTVRRAQRDFIHVDSLVGSLIGLALSDITGPVNVGSGRSHSSQQILEMLVAALGLSLAEVDYKVAPPAPGDAPDIRLNVAKLRSMLRQSAVAVPKGPTLREWLSANGGRTGSDGVTEM